MTLLGDIVHELAGMFLADARLSIAILALVLIAAGPVRAAGAQPLVVGGVLLAGSLLILVESVVREARRQRRS